MTDCTMMHQKHTALKEISPLDFMNSVQAGEPDSFSPATVKRFGKGIKTQYKIMLRLAKTFDALLIFGKELE